MQSTSLVLLVMALICLVLAWSVWHKKDDKKKVTRTATEPHEVPEPVPADHEHIGDGDIMFTFLLGGARRILNLTITSTTANYNLYNSVASLIGHAPTYPLEVNVTVNAGVTLYGTNTSTPGFETGSGWSSGTDIKLINNGTIVGCGGAGGAGGGNTGSGDGFPGNDGGLAVNMQFALEIDNTNGYIFGGGGGAGGGGATYDSSDTVAGGGGGGGAAYGAGGAIGVGTTCSASPAAQPGSAGTLTTGGAGGAGGCCGGVGCAAAGGTGGNQGYAGAAGGDVLYGPVGGAGGNPGASIVHNSNTITWLGGNNTTQVRPNVV